MDRITKKLKWDQIKPIQTNRLLLVIVILPNNFNMLSKFLGYYSYSYFRESKIHILSKCRDVFAQFSFSFSLFVTEWNIPFTSNLRCACVCFRSRPLVPAITVTANIAEFWTDIFWISDMFMHQLSFPRVDTLAWICLK